MPTVFAMSFEGTLAPDFHLRCLSDDTPRPDGWGIAFYGQDEVSVTVFKEATPPQNEGRPRLMQGLERQASSVFLMQVRAARWGRSDHLSNTQPFSRSWRGRDWAFAHGGSMKRRLEMAGESRFEPVGSTDSELIFCELMNRIADRRWRNLGYADFSLVRQWMAEFAQYGDMSSVLTDGRDVLVYSDGKSPMLLWEVKPPHGEISFSDDQAVIDLTSRGVKGHRGVIVASNPMEIPEDVREHIEPVELKRGSLVVIREGQIRLRVEPADEEDISPSSPTIVVRPALRERPKKQPARVYEVKHRTAYSYEKPVEHSTHMLRLTPIHDRLQDVLEHEVSVSVDGRTREYEDVFGNAVKKVLLEQPYKELVIEATSKVRVLDRDPLSFKPIHARTTVPLVWMPWQRQLLTPYLLPPELPETQLLTLIDYAMSFVKRNDYDIVETLIDINATLFRDYQYLPGSTNVFTTAWEVYSRRRGVCQDFTNLFICLARLLGVPARYVCGYIYTGPKNPNQIQSEASHAWVQLYLPEVGWKGFDPTNGILTQTDHVRVAVGRNYIDATPTSGTIFVGGGRETLSAEVWVEPLEEEGESPGASTSSGRVVADVVAGGSMQVQTQQAAQQAPAPTSSDAADPGDSQTGQS